MKTCEQCAQQNPDEALFCLQCGARYPSPETVQPVAESQLWRAFIGQNADRYLEQFRKFTRGQTPRFALTWHWPAFLFEPFLWFLYRKMYLYALVYAVGPVIAFAVTKDLTSDFVWRLVAGISANYLYYWHVRERIGRARAQPGLDAGAQERLLREAGGVQPYVIWVGVGMFLLKVALLIALIREGPPTGNQVQRDSLWLASSRVRR